MMAEFVIIPSTSSSQRTTGEMRTTWRVLVH